jgi:hypothetical protein
MGGPLCRSSDAGLPALLARVLHQVKLGLDEICNSALIIDEGLDVPTRGHTPPFPFVPNVAVLLTKRFGSRQNISLTWDRHFGSSALNAV